MPKLPIYMDCHATTPTDPRVVEAMLPWFTEKFGNAASTNHSFGWAAEEAVDRAREQVAHLIGAQSREIIFTSGATESNNLAVKGPARLHGTKRNHIITVVTEHRAVLDPCRSLERDGCEVTYLPVDSNGLLDPKEIAAAITEKTLLVSVMIANNEIGTLQPIEEIGEICKTKEVYFHTDAAQAVGKIPVNVQTMGIDLLSISGHKLYAPKGIGGLYIRSRGPRVRLEPMIDGGGHERGLRSGTLPVPLIVGLGEAARIASEEMSGESERLANLKNRLHDRICAEVPDVMLNGHPKSRLPGNLNLSFPGVNGEALLMRLKHVAVSSGSACTSAEPEPSYVLRALGVDEEMAHSSLRFGLGRFNTEEEVDWVAAHVGEQVRALREMAVK